MGYLIAILVGLTAFMAYDLMGDISKSKLDRGIAGALVLTIFALFMAPARAAEAYERSTGAPTVSYDPKAEMVNEVAVRTVECMQERIIFTLRYGATDPVLIANDAALICGSMLVSVLGNTAKSAAVVLELARIVLRSTPGVRVSK